MWPHAGAAGGVGVLVPSPVVSTKADRHRQKWFGDHQLAEFPDDGFAVQVVGNCGDAERLSGDLAGDNWLPGRTLHDG